LDLVTTAGIELVKLAYKDLRDKTAAEGFPLPKNELGRNKLDCAVINWLHENRASDGEEPIDTVRGLGVFHVPRSHLRGSP
jgi:hypothetical protein